MTDQSWPLFEVFLRGKRGLNHVHVGSLHAADPEMAIHRDQVLRVVKPKIERRDNTA